MDRWKKAGRAGRNEDDAAVGHSSAPPPTPSSTRVRPTANRSAPPRRRIWLPKEALLVEGRGTRAGGDRRTRPSRPASGARARFRRSGIRSATCRVTTCAASRGRLDAVDNQIKAVEDAAWKQTDPEADARKSSFEGAAQRPARRARRHRSRPGVRRRRRRPSSRPRRPPRSSGSTPSCDCIASTPPYMTEAADPRRGGRFRHVWGRLL